MLSKENPLIVDFLLFIEICKYGFFLLIEAHTVNGYLSRMVRNPVHSYERSGFQSTIGDTVYKDDDLVPILRDGVERLRRAIQELAYTLNKFDLKKIGEK